MIVEKHVSLNSLLNSLLSHWQYNFMGLSKGFDDILRLYEVATAAEHSTTLGS